MKVLILGGTSFFGKEIVRQFNEAGHEVTVFTRGNHALNDLPEHRHIQGDREKLEDLVRANAVDSFDVVIDNIAFTAAHVRAALKAFSKTSHYILCSTISVYRYAPAKYPWPLTDGEVSHEYQPPEENLGDIHWKYARGKLEAEKECMKQRKVPWTILRPTVVYGPEDPTDLGFWYLMRLLSGGPMLLADSGSQSFRLLYSVDCARAFLQVAENRKRVLRKCYLLGQSEIITLRDFIEESAKALGVVPDYLCVAGEVLKEMGGPYASLTNIIPDSSAARRDFGFATTPFADFIRVTSEWFRDHWKGDEAKMLESRDKEIAFAQRWKTTVKI